jgi:hypothetical protein
MFYTCLTLSIKWVPKCPTWQDAVRAIQSYMIWLFLRTCCADVLYLLNFVDQMGTEMSNLARRRSSHTKLYDMAFL